MIGIVEFGFGAGYDFQFGIITGLDKELVILAQNIHYKIRIELIGAGIEAINKAEDRDQFKEAMTSIGLDLPRSGQADSLKHAWEIAEEVGFPNVIRPSFTLGGTGGSVAYTKEEFDRLATWGLEASPVGRVLIEESVLPMNLYAGIVPLLLSCSFEILFFRVSRTLGYQTDFDSSHTSA